MNVNRLSRRDPRYPRLLAEIPDPPAQLWTRGAHVDALGGRGVAVVGARACSAYGRTVARSLARDLAAAGVVVVSGLARGVDAEAHRGALDVGGVTVAVLGCGIDRDYPAAHRDLAQRIVESGGLVVSEYEPGVEPAPWRFPARNRIIAGLCEATVVVEARERSGALITADFALEDGREVYAVPGEITSALSEGTNALLRLGATPLTRSGDVLVGLGLDEASHATTEVPAGPPAALYEALRVAAATIDELVQATDLSPAEVAAGLVALELRGVVVADAGTYRVAAARSASTIPR